MDAYSSGDVKARKPYTITKQRERWSDEEHNRFLEALKLYGRAWQRIEEHIGTKTAVQIRSHAQKFFSKLEKEALVKGVPVEQAIDIEIPPPRPKKKPSNPYPRKTGAVCSPNAQVRAKDGNHIPLSPNSAKVVDLEKEPQLEKQVCDDGDKFCKGTCDGDGCFEVARKLSNLKEFVPEKSTLVNDKGSESHAADKPNIGHKPGSVEIAQKDSKNEMHAGKSFSKHAPVQVLDGSQGTCSQGLSSDVSHQEPRPQMKFVGNPARYTNPTISGAEESHKSTFRSNNQQIYPNFHPSYNPFPSNQGDYSSFLQMSSTFSSMILSVLLQNPAAYASASSAAHLWPATIPENSPRPMNTSPSLASIAAATVAAATAWWAAHGIMPLAAPILTGFPFHPSSVANVDKEENGFQIPESRAKQPEQDQHSASKSSETSSPDSGNSGELMDVGVGASNAEKVPPISELIDTNKGKNKQVDRSSCGSNTPSGSDAETDALGKDGKGNEELKEPDENFTFSDLNGRRSRLVGNTNDNWKEVSEGGRLAFRALFSRGRLPQSFSPPQEEMNDGVKDQSPNSERSNEEGTQLDLNSKPREPVSSDQGPHRLDSGNNKDGMTTGLLQAKLTSNATGFKPYKRCSVESRMMNSGNQEQENCSKRLRLEKEAST